MIVDPDFPDHWKTRMLVNLLQDEAAPVYLLRLWAHCQNRKQSEFESLTPEALKALCRFPGHANSLESSLAASGFVRRDDRGYLLVLNWDDYNSGLVANWENGRKGGRPRKPIENPNPKSVNPIETDSREKKRLDGLEGKGKERRSFSEADLATARWMLPLIRDAYAAQPDPDFDDWANTIRLMRERDGLADEEIRGLFSWANKDTFWRSNIRGPDKLRSQWHTLNAQKIGGKGSGKPSQPKRTGHGQRFQGP